MKHMKALFIQLPEQDPANLASMASVPLFAGSLIAQALHNKALERSEYSLLDQNISDFGGDCAILTALLGSGAEALFFTLFDYNYDRSLFLAKALRGRMPATLLIALGPEACAGTPLAHSRTFDAILELPETVEWSSFCYPDAAAFCELLQDLRKRCLKPRYQILPAGSLKLAPQYKDPYLMSIIPICADKPVYAGFPCLDILPPAQLQADLVHTAPLLIQQACAANAREIVLANPGIQQIDQASVFIKTLAAANSQGIGLLLNWQVDQLNEDLAKLLIDANLLAMRSQLLSTNPESLQECGHQVDLPAIERNAQFIWAQSAILKLSLYLGLPQDSYDTVIDSFDYLGMSGLGQDADLRVINLLPGTLCRKNIENFGIVENLGTPPYTVTETETMQEEDFLDALGDFEESFDIAVSPPVRPCLQSERNGYAACVDLRKPGAFDQLLVNPERLANSVTILVDADNPELLKRLGTMAPDLRRENPYTLWQLVLCSDNSIPSDAAQLALTEAFVMPEHYFELQHLFSLDPQNTWQLRLFFATNSEALALRALHESRELETIFIIRDSLPGLKLLEANPFIAFNKDRLGFELLYDLMNSYRNFQDLLLESTIEGL